MYKSTGAKCGAQWKEKWAFKWFLSNEFVWFSLLSAANGFISIWIVKAYTPVKMTSRMTMQKKREREKNEWNTMQITSLWHSSESTPVSWRFQTISIFYSFGRAITNFFHLLSCIIISPRSAVRFLSNQPLYLQFYISLISFSMRLLLRSSSTFNLLLWIIANKARDYESIVTDV